VSASDYRDDIRISENILKQLSDAYRRIRNTCRFMLGNLFDYDPKKDFAVYESMVDIDKFALHRLQEIIERTRNAYDSYDFHIIYHTLHNYCALDLSAFYLDILKDRLYTSPPESSARRSAQTVLYIILDSIVRLMAPVLSFTSEEIWNFMPGYKGKETSIHLASLPDIKEEWKDSNLAKKWHRILEVRGEVTKALEKARVDKLIGHPLDASVTISANEDLYNGLYLYVDDLRSIFITSEASLVKDESMPEAYESEDIEGLSILVKPATAEKCERCWIHDNSVGTNSEQPTICNRCQDTLEE
jgi:isoleucyl-tRNA synthetase